MLSAAFATIRYRTDGRFFDLRRLKANAKVQEALVRDFLFADGYTMAAHPEKDLQCLADCFSTAAKALGLTISVKKTEVKTVLRTSKALCRKAASRSWRYLFSEANNIDSLKSDGHLTYLRGIYLSLRS